MSLSIEALASILASDGDGISADLRSEERALIRYTTAYGSEARLGWRNAHETSVRSLESLGLSSLAPKESTTKMENAPRLLGTVQLLSARIDGLRRKTLREDEDLSQDHVTKLHELLSTYLEQSSRVLRKIPDRTSTAAEGSTSSPTSAGGEGSSDGSSTYTLAHEVITGEPEPEVAAEEPTVQDESTAAQEEDIDSSSEPSIAVDLKQLEELIKTSQTDLQTARERFEAYRDAPFGGEQTFKSHLDEANQQWLSSRKTFLEALSTYTGTDHTKLQLGGVQQGVEQMLNEAKKKTADLQQELSSLAESSTQAEGQSLNDDIITKYVETSSALADFINPKQYEPQVGRF